MPGLPTVPVGIFFKIQPILSEDCYETIPEVRLTAQYLCPTNRNGMFRVTVLLATGGRCIFLTRHRVIPVRKPVLCLQEAV